MPTTEPLDIDGDLGGQLEYIAAMHGAAPAAPATPTTTVAAQPPATPQPTAYASARTAVAAPSASGTTIHGGLRTNLRTPGVSLRRGIIRQDDASKQAATATDRSQPFDDTAFAKAWQAYIDANPTQRIVVNTMRACVPTRVSADSTQYTMRVENTIQVEQMKAAMPHLMQYLHNALSNDQVTIDFVVADVSESPMSWDQREVLAHILENHPTLRNAIEIFDFKLD